MPDPTLVVTHKSLIYSKFIVCMLTKIGVGEMIYDIRKKIQEIQLDLDDLEKPVIQIPELITSANLLRSNEYLSKINEKKTDLLSAYAQYSESLEELLSSVFEIQTDLKEILKEQSSLISSQTKQRKPKPKSKTSKK